MKILWLFFIFVFLPLFLVFQNCSENKLKDSEFTGNNKILGGFNNQSPSMSGGSGNGEPYGGKLTYFAFEIGHTCKDASGKEVPSPHGTIVKSDTTFTLKFDNCSDTNEVIDASAVTSLNGGDRPSIIYKNQIFQKFDELPNISELPIPEKFCFETSLFDSIANQTTGSFYDMITFGSYSKGRTTQIIERAINNGQVNLGAIPINKVEVTEVQKTVDDLFFWYIAQVFKLELDLSLTKQSQIENISYTEYLGETQLQLGNSTKTFATTCSDIPVLPLIVGPPPVPPPVTPLVSPPPKFPN